MSAVRPEFIIQNGFQKQTAYGSPFKQVAFSTSESTLLKIKKTEVQTGSEVEVMNSVVSSSRAFPLRLKSSFALSKLCLGPVKY